MTETTIKKQFNLPYFRPQSAALKRPRTAATRLRHESMDVGQIIGPKDKYAPKTKDREELYRLVLELKKQVNFLNNELSLEKSNSLKQQNDLDNYKKLVEEFSEGKDEDDYLETAEKGKSKNLIYKLKRDFKAAKLELKDTKRHNEALRRSIKITKINELTQEREVLMQELAQTKGLLEISEEQNYELKMRLENYALTKRELEEYKTQTDLYKEENEKLKIEREEILADMDAQRAKLEKKSRTVKELRKKVKNNEKLLESRNKVTSELVTIKMETDEMKEKLREVQKEANIYKQQASDYQYKYQDAVKQGASTSAATHQMFSVVEKPNEDLEEEQNKKYELLKAKYKELVRQLEGNSEFNSAGGYNTGLEAHSIGTGKFIPGAKETMFEINEFIYILMKNLEGRDFTPEDIENKIGTKANNSDFENKPDSVVSEVIIECLNANAEDSDEITRLFTILYNNEGRDLQAFLEKISTVYESLQEYKSKKEVYSDKIRKYWGDKLENLKSDLKQADEENTGFVNFTQFKEIFEDNKVDDKVHYVEFMIYLMKQYSNDSFGLRYLDYSKLLDVLSTPTEAKESVSMSNLNDSSNDQIEISNEEFNQRIDKILEAVADYINLNNISLKELVGETETFDGYNTVANNSVIGMLNKVNCNLEELDMFCLYTKYKLNDDLQSINFDKLEEDIKNFYGKRPETDNKLESINENDLSDDYGDDLDFD